MFDRITSFTNLYAAAKAAGRGKHDRAEVLRHDLQLEKILFHLQWRLRHGQYRHGNYRQFLVRDPKSRDVNAAPFTDRIVHHAVVRVLEPVFEAGFIYDSYACRSGKGTHAAALRLQHFLRSAHFAYDGQFYVLRADIRKFFANIDHGILTTMLERRLGDGRTMALLRTIIASYREPVPGGGQYKQATGLPPVGLPIGNLTSQLFANIYLDRLDQLVKHQLGARYYLRYMDDFVVLHQSKAELWGMKYQIEQYCQDELRLQLHSKKTGVHKYSGRERFVGYDLELWRRRLARPTVRRFMRRLGHTHRLQGDAAAQTSWQQFQAYAAFADSTGLLRSINPFADSDSSRLG